MLDHEKVREITSDVYNKFYLPSKGLQASDEAWRQIVNLAEEIAEKHNGDRLCKDLLNAYMDEMERAFEKEQSETLVQKAERENTNRIKGR